MRLYGFSLLAMGAVLMLAATGKPLADSTPTLPPAECIRMLREARLTIEGGSRCEGLRKLRAVAEAFPREWLPVLELWSQHRAGGQPDAEAEELRALLTRRLVDPESRIPAGMLGYLVQSPGADQDELRLVLESASRRLTLLPKDRDLLAAVAGLQERLGLKPEARATLGRLLTLDPTDEMRLRCIDMDIDLERWSDAVQLLEPMMKRNPVPPVARVTYTLALGKLGRHEALSRELERLQADDQILRETIVDILLQAAWDLRDLGNDEQAEHFFRKVLESDPEHQEARAVVFHLYSTEDERSAQQALLDDAWRAESDPSRLLDQGAKLLAAGDAVRALPVLERSAASLPDSEVAWFNLGLCAFQLERWQQAADALAQATRLNPRRAAAYFNRGAALSKLNRCTEAIIDLERTLTLDPDLKQVHYYLYVCHRNLGNDEAALREYRLYNE